MNRTGLWASGLMILLAATSAWAGRPLETSDTEPVDKGHFELELAVGYVRDGNNHHYDFPLALTYGLIERLEVGIGFGGQLEEREEVEGDRDTESGIGDLELGAKFKLLDQKDLWPSHALGFTVKLPTADEDKGLGSGEVDYDLTWIVSCEISDKLCVHFNLGYTWLGDTEDEDFSDVLYYSVAATYALTEQWEPVAEIIAETPVEDGGRTAVGVSVGICWNLNDSLTLDAAIGTKLVNDWPDLTATVGLTWAF